MRAGDHPRATWVGLAVLLAGSGALHLLAPGVYEGIVPGWAGDARRAVVISGGAELVGAGLLVSPRTRRVGGLYAAAVFVAVFPANVKMALDAGSRGPAWAVGSWLRLPLQVPLVWWATSIARTGRLRCSKP